jgi:hypothetical protein
MARLMVCPNCGAPLPASVAQVAFIRCAFCHATSNVESREVTQREEVGLGLDSDADLFTQRVRAREQFHAAMQSLNSAGPIHYALVRELCERHLPTFGQTDSIARVTYNLALDYETETGESLRTRGEVLARLAFGYLEVVRELRTKPRHELSLPFLFATPEGPKHYARTLDVATIIALSERDPEQREDAATVITSSGPQKKDGDEPAPKRGFWSKLFG